MSEIRLQDTSNPYNGTYPTVFKKLHTSDVNVVPFQVYKSWTLLSGSTTSSFTPLVGVYTDIHNLPALGSELTFNDDVNIDGSLQSVTYFSINHLCYKNKKQPFNVFGPNDINQTKKFLYQTASILSIPQIKIGDGIKPASFTFTSSVSGSYASDRYGNIIDTGISTSSIIDAVKFYEGFNEYFDTSRINYISCSLSTFIPGIPTTNGRQLNLGLAAVFSGSNYVSTPVDGYYDRNHNYAVSFFISSSNFGTANQLIAGKLSNNTSQIYPFKIELSGSKQIVFSAAGSDTLKTQITSSAFVSSSWTHILCQKSGSNLQMYVNGTLHASVTNTLLGVYNSPLTASARIDNDADLKIGGYSSATGSFNLNARLDEIRVYNKALSSAQISALSDRTEGGTALQTNVVGNVMPAQGLIVFSSADYRINDLLKTPFTSSYRSTVNLYEMNVLTRIDSGDFNLSLNHSLTIDNNETYLPFVTSSTFTPYITTIGLYDEYGRLLAIGKLAQPIRKRNDVDMNILIRLDLDKNISFKG